MKFKVHMKDPDALGDAINEAVRAEVEARDDLASDEQETLIEMREEKIGEICEKWFEFGEYLTVEIDTDAQTCVVVPRK